MTPELVIGFAAARRAPVGSVEWWDSNPALVLDPTQWPAIAVFAGDTPTGPWQRLGTLQGSGPRRLDVAPLVARYIRLAAETAVTGNLLFPAEIRVTEVPGPASSAGEWGMAAPTGRAQPRRRCDAAYAR